MKLCSLLSKCLLRVSSNASLLWGGAEVGRGLGAEGGGVRYAELEPQAGLMGPRSPDPLRAEPPSSPVPLLSAARRARCPLRPEGSLGGWENASVPGAPRQARVPRSWDLGQ